MAHLAAISVRPDSGYTVNCIREFTPDESGKFAKSMKQFQTLRERLSLLHILESNLVLLTDFLSVVQSSKNIKANALHEANRLVMNYLYSAYALREQLGSALKRDFGRASAEVRTFEQLLTALERESFEYAFLQDFRGYAQHCALPIGNFEIIHEGHGRSYNLTYARKQLLAKSKDWKKSKLNARAEDNLDLKAIIIKHHLLVDREFTAFIQKAYGSDLAEISAYFEALYKEATQADPMALGKILTSVEGTPDRGVITLQDIPRNLLQELRSHAKPLAIAFKDALPGQSPISVNREAPQAEGRPRLSLLSYKIDERDRFFDVRKNDITGYHPEMVNLDYDPFPAAKNSDTVWQSLMGRELFLIARFRGGPIPINLGVKLQVAGHAFVTDKVTMHIDCESDVCDFDVEGSKWLTYTEPLRLIADLRSNFAQGSKLQ